MMHLRGHGSWHRHKGAGATDGFTLIETLIAVFILAFGLMSAGRLIYLALASESLARSKASAAVAAQSKLEQLADLYLRDAGSAALTVGDHGPETVEITNPADGGVLNRYSITWTISEVPDPRPGRALRSRRVDVVVLPVDAADNRHYRAFFNKAVTVSTIFGPRRL
jgi:prepilin-type N-terminal cleavage/methylation domain-containing protein